MQGRQHSMFRSRLVWTAVGLGGVVSVAALALSFALSSAHAAPGDEVKQPTLRPGTAAPATPSQSQGRPPSSPPPPAAPPVAAPLPPAAGLTAPIDVDAAIAGARSLGDAFASVAERVSPSVVSIRIEARQPQLRGPGGQFRLMPGYGMPEADQNVVHGSGSGVIISSDGAILTNNHVIQNASRIEVLMRDGRRLLATVVGVDSATDLAVLRVPATGLPAAPLADSDRARVGEWVVAVGSPFGLDYTVTAGVLSAVGREGIGANEIEDYLQTDASINPGNSGGPLLNLNGEVLGINTMIIGRGTGIGFAIPSSLARNVADQLLTTGTVRRASIGVTYQEMSHELASSFGAPDPRGALIANVLPDGPASRAGLREGDIVREVDGVPLSEGRDLLRMVLRKRVGDRVRLSVLRGGRALTIETTTTDRAGDANPSANVQPRAPQAPSAQRQMPSLGMMLQNMNANLASQLGFVGRGGVVVMRVLEGSPADRAGVRPGDVIVEADRQTVARTEHVDRALADGQGLLRVQRRGGAAVYMLVKVDA